MSHARLSPSAADRWMVCTAAPNAEEGRPDTRSEYADEGTAAHFLASECLTQREDADAFSGAWIGISEGGAAAWGYDGTEASKWQVDSDMVGYVQQYLDAVRAYAHGGELLVEQRLPITSITGEPGAHGTADAVVLVDREMQIHDLKYGRGKLVRAERNKQLLIYAGAALLQYGGIYEIDKVRLVIHQPRVSAHPVEWDTTPAEIMEFCGAVGTAAEATRSAPEYRPGEEQCRWCKASGDCRAQAEHVARLVSDDFDDLTRPVQPVPAEGIGVELLAHLHGQLDMIESWCGAIRARIADTMASGQQVPGLKMVAGRKGARRWADQDAAEALFKSFRFKQEDMYQFKLISPTQAEKALAKDMPRRWAKLAALVEAPEGKPAIVPVSDPRPAIDAGFENLETQEE